MEELNPLILYSCSVNPQQTNEQRPGIPVTEFIGDTCTNCRETEIPGLQSRDSGIGTQSVCMRVNIDWQGMVV